MNTHINKLDEYIFILFSIVYYHFVSFLKQQI